MTESEHFIIQKGTPKQSELFKEGYMIHITHIPLDVVLAKGLLSPIALARSVGKTISEGTVWHNFENCYVKFLGFEADDWAKNFGLLRNHFEIFGVFEPTIRSLGFVVKPHKSIRLWEEAPYFGIEAEVPPNDIKGIVIPFVPMMILDIDHLSQRENSRAVQSVFNSLLNINNGVLSESLPVFDHFGRIISRQST